MNTEQIHQITRTAAALLLLLLLLSALLPVGCTGKTGLDGERLQHTFPSPHSSSMTGVHAPPSPAPSSDRMEVKIFFANSEKDPQEEKPDITYPITLTFKSEAPEEIARKMLEQLITGPAEPYKKQGYYTALDPATKINSVKIENETIHLDFNNKINEGGGSCIMDQRRSQIEHTFLNMPGIKIRKVAISVNGNTENVLQP